MKIAIFNTKPYDRKFLEAANSVHRHDLTFFEPRLNHETTALAAGFPAVCVFVNDQLDETTLSELAHNGTRLLALRCAGFNNVDLTAVQDLGLTVVRVPAYSPYAVAEHTIALILALNRKIHRAYNRVRDGNFALEGMLGFDIHGKTAGIIGTGEIGAVVARILKGFGCHLLAYDLAPNPACVDLGANYVSLEKLLSESDIVTLHCPLTPDTHHLIDNRSLHKIKPGAMLVNTSRGAVIDTQAVVDSLKSDRLGSLGIDVYEEEADLFFEDLSSEVIHDDVLARLLTFPNVIVTGHQAFFTREALEQIAETTLCNIAEFERTNACANQITAEKIAT